MKHKIIKIERKDFPEKLKKIKKPPEEIYIIGNKNLLLEDCFGIVGTRKITEYGIKNCENFSREFVFRNIPVVSGMAIGTDSVAHRTALEYEGKTIAVLGSGFGNIFPKENIQLFEKIIENNGLIVTEFEYDEKPKKENFPKRNRIITALSEGILVIEAGYRSGSSITAKNAVEQGKKVFALPGLLDSKVGVGVNTLIKKGAILTTSIEDIIKNYPQFVKRMRITNTKKEINNVEIKNEYKDILKVIRNTDGTIESILNSTELNLREILTLLTQMEIEKLISQDISGRYILLGKGE